MGTKSSSKSCSIMGSSREDLRVWYGKVSGLGGLFCSEKQLRRVSRLFAQRSGKDLQKSSQVPQVLSQFLSRPVDVGLHRAEGELDDLRDFVVGIILNVPEDDAGPILRP